MRAFTVAMATLLVLGVAQPSSGQSTLERGPVQPETWSGIPWSLELAVAPLFGRVAADDMSGLTVDPAVRAALVLPAGWVAEARYAPQPAERGGADEIEAALRTTPMRQDHGGFADLAVEARAAAGSDAAAATVAAARWMGSLRVMAHARALFTRDDSPQLAGGAGALWHPAPGRLPLAVAGDLVSVAFDRDGHRVGWTAALQLGVSFTPHTLSLFATNTGHSLPGRSTGTDRTRVGLEVTTHVPLGRFFGLHTPRAVAREAVRPQADAPRSVTVPIREYRYAPDRVEIEAGTAVVWVNHDHAIHTATADDGSWSSGAIAEGESWSAVFDEPGTYTYHCGPHPFMRGVVVVKRAPPVR
jgi:plastocyanin